MNYLAFGKHTRSNILVTSVAQNHFKEIQPPHQFTMPLYSNDNTLRLLALKELYSMLVPANTTGTQTGTSPQQYLAQRHKNHWPLPSPHLRTSVPKISLFLSSLRVMRASYQNPRSFGLSILWFTITRPPTAICSHCRRYRARGRMSEAVSLVISSSL